MSKKKIALFASGTGSNALNMISYFKAHPNIEVAFVLSNKTDAPIVKSAAERGVKVLLCTNSEVEKPGFLLEICEKNAVDYIILAGFLRKIPVDLIQAYPTQIVNVHPALLPSYGGQGMYGAHVHRAVLANQEQQSGITIHRVNEEFDRGEILAQFTCTLSPQETLETLQAKIHELEMENFPRVVEQTMLSQLQ